MLCIAGKEEEAIALAEESHQFLTLAEVRLSFTVLQPVYFATAAT